MGSVVMNTLIVFLLQLLLLINGVILQTIPIQSAVCGKNISMVTSMCECDDGFYGNNCELCSKEPAACTNPNTTLTCSGRGICHCEMCHCHELSQKGKDYNVFGTVKITAKMVSKNKLDCQERCNLSLACVYCQLFPFDNCQDNCTNWNVNQPPYFDPDDSCWFDDYTGDPTCYASSRDDMNTGNFVRLLGVRTKGCLGMTSTGNRKLADYVIMSAYFLLYIFVSSI